MNSIYQTRGRSSKDEAKAKPEYAEFIVLTENIDLIAQYTT